MRATPINITPDTFLPIGRRFAVRVATRDVSTTVTELPATVRRWVRKIWSVHRHRFISGRLVVGLCVQWTPPIAPLNGPQRPDTLQLCVGHRCLVFQIGLASAIPQVLHRFFNNPLVTFVGVNFESNRRKLRHHFNLNVKFGYELRELVDMGNASIERIAEEFIGFTKIKKPKNVAMSDWDSRQLSNEQVLFACLNAYLAFRLGVRFRLGERH